MIPPKDKINICFAHRCVSDEGQFDALNTGIANFEVRDRETIDRRVAEADVLVRLRHVAQRPD